jgi:hypothetical protein
VSCVRDSAKLRSSLPALHTDIVELILAGFALPLGRHVFESCDLSRARVVYCVDASGRRVAGDVGVVWSARAARAGGKRG